MTAKKLALRSSAIIFYSGAILLLILGMLMPQSAEAERIETNKISLIPIGEIAHDVLKHLQQELVVRFSKKVEIRSGLPGPDYAYTSNRDQYYSSSILGELSFFICNHDCEKALGIVDVDLYVPRLNFVFGEAEFRNKGREI